MRKSFKDFTNMYPVQKTLRFELKPLGKTEQHIKESFIIEHDEQRSNDYKAAKKIIDDYHRLFIQKTLSQTDLDWKDLKEALEYDGEDKDKRLETVQKDKRSKIICRFTEQPEFKKLFGKELFSELLPEMINAENADNKDEKLHAAAAFDKFSTYFKGFHDNRRNIYSNEEISTSVAYRIVHQNFPKFLANAETFKTICKKAPEIIEQTQKELSKILGKHKLEDIFRIESFNNVMTQDGIDYYNNIIDGVPCEAGKKKLRGVNEFASIYRQQHPDTKIQIKMVPLYKQILSDRATLSFMPAALDNDGDAFEAVAGLEKMLNEPDAETKTSVLQQISALFAKPSDYSQERVWINQKSVPVVSAALFGSWDTLGSALAAYKENELGDTRGKDKKVEKWIKSKAFSFASLDAAADFYKDSLPGEKSARRIKDYFAGCRELVKNTSEKQKEFDKIKDSALFGNETNTSAVKAYLDSLNDILRFMRPFETEDITDIDTEFYSAYSVLLEKIKMVIPVYNTVRNYVTKKPFKTDKFKLNFENPTLAYGWDKSKEQANTAILLMKDDKYYLGIMNAKHKIKPAELADDHNGDGYKKMQYMQMSGPTKDLPNLLVIDGKTVRKTGSKDANGVNRKQEQLKNTYLPPDINEIRLDGSYLETSNNFSKKNSQKYLAYYMKLLKEYKSNFDFNFKKANEYESYYDFTNDIKKQCYSLTFTNLAENKVDKWVDEGRLYLFQIWNKDFAEGVSGRPNLHTLYWKALFSPENLKNVVYKLNGKAELFFRRKSINEPVVHPTGSKKVNRRDIDGSPIDDETFNEIYLYANGKRALGSLGAAARALVESKRVRITDVKHELVKDKRYTQDKFFFHVSLTINFKASGKENINSDVNLFLKNNKDVKIIGIDRGERNLIYISLIDRKGNIIEQKHFNTVGGMDYHAKLDQREKARDEARKSWKTIGNIKELKEGYLSQVIHEITKMAVENDAIIAMEDLNVGFKRGRFKVEKQVYQKFEEMLINKLNYLSFKDTGENKQCGIRNGLQLAGKFTSFKKIGKQCGIIFYVPAGYTSKIDPVTGFVSVFNLSAVTSQEKQKEFIDRLDSIRYDKKLDMFVFSFDYSEFKTYQTLPVTKWDVYTNGKRIINKREGSRWIPQNVVPTEEMKRTLKQLGIEYESGRDILPVIMERDKKLASDVFYIFKNTLQMRNSNAATGEDYIISPVKGKKGVFFSSSAKDKSLPQDADANGAYHIALKGSLVLDAIDEKLKDDGKMSYKDMYISNPDWFKFMQTGKH